MSQVRHSWGERRQVTLLDVAKVAGVSQSAASVVLNGARSGTRVSADKRRSVLEAADKMGYRPNAVARALSTGRSHRIGIYTTQFLLTSQNSFYADLLGGVFDGASEIGVNTMVHTTGRDENSLLDLVSNRSIDGLIIQAPANDPILPILGELRMPAVAVVDRIDSLPSVIVDDKTGGMLLAQHLSMLGHRNVLLKQTAQGQRSGIDRMEGFKQAASRLGMDTIDGFAGHYDVEGLDLNDIQALTEGANRATAVVGWSDFTSEKICLKLLSLGVLVPNTVAVVGFDGFDYPTAPRFRLTTIKAPWSQVGREATRVLNSLIAGEDVPAITTMPVEFIRGNTT